MTDNFVLVGVAAGLFVESMMANVTLETLRMPTMRVVRKLDQMSRFIQRLIALETKLYMQFARQF